MKSLYLTLTLALLGLISSVAYAQVSDSFSDDDFTQNPPWFGDVGEFEVASQRLRLLSSGADTSVLYTANTGVNDTEWRFWFRLAFAPSDNNYTRLYLVSNQFNIKDPLNGYFLRYGENGSSDGVDLWRQDGNTLTKIIDGMPNPNATSTNQLIRVKVIRSAAGQWELYADYTGGYAYQLLGTATDITYNNTVSLGVWCKYTTSNASNFYFDDIYAGPIIVDVTPPEVMSIQAISADTVSIFFSEPVTQATATATSNYTIAGIGNPTAVIYSLTSADNIKLVLPSPLVPEQAYGLTISSVQDFSGNVMMAFTGEVSFYQPLPYDVIISEIMADPTPVVGLPDAEFIELYNRRNFPIDVTGWKIKIGSYTRTISSGVIPADSFLVLMGNPVPAEFSTINAVAVTSFPALANSGTTVTLLSPSGQTINSVSYQLSWYGNTVKDDGGWTLEIINPNDFCNGANNWIASNDTTGGTPGRRNSVNDSHNVIFKVTHVQAINATQMKVYFSQLPDANTLTASAFHVTNGIGNPDSVKIIDANTWRLYFSTSFLQQAVHHLTVSATILNCVQQPITENLVFPFTYYAPIKNDVIITEIMADPDPAVALPNAEYLELYNKTASPIDIAGWKIQSGSSIRTIPYGVIPADSFIVLTVNPLPPPYLALNAVAIPSFPSITNGFGTVRLLSPNNEILNEVSYHISWYRDAVKNDGGWSLEMINPNDLCNGAENWIASQHMSGGTPAARNSVHNPQPVYFTLLSAFAINASQVDVYFSQVVDVASLLPGAFSINQNIGMPDSVVYMGNGLCRLFFSAEFSQQAVYELTVAPTLTNCVQQPLTGNMTATFTFYTAKQNDVIITEIMADEYPSQGLPTYEYVEIYNRSASAISLKGWRFSAGNNSVELPHYLLPSHAYLTLTKTAGQSLFPNNVLGVASFPILANSGATLVLTSGEGRQIHSVSYKDTWITESFKRDGGWSMEMKDVGNPCAGKENWAASVHPDGGTPGMENSIKTINLDHVRPYPIRVGLPSPDSVLVYFSEPLNMNLFSSQFYISQGIGTPGSIYLEPPGLQTVSMKLNTALESDTKYEMFFSGIIEDCVSNLLEVVQPLRFELSQFPIAGDIIINEVLFDPKGSGEDYIELFNRSSKAVDLRDIFVGDYDSVTKQMQTVKTIASRSAILNAGEYVLLSRDKADIFANYSTTDVTAFWDIASMPKMSNSGGSIAICDNNFSVLDAFTFTEQFHFSLLSNKDGVSLERINTEIPTQNRYNWTSASAASGYGTPGYRNSQAGVPAEQDDVLTLSPEIFSPDQDGYEDVLFISYEFPTSGNVISIHIYDELGRLMKKLVNAEYCGTSGVYTWDGGTDNGIRPKVGIYVVVAEWFNETGEKGRAKKAVVLGTKL